jgi:hypothetical protein
VPLPRPAKDRKDIDEMMRRYITWDPWVDALAVQDPCLGRVVHEAVVVREAAMMAGAASRGSPRRCRTAFDSAGKILDAVRLGRIEPNTDTEWTRASEALRKFNEALECAAPAPRRSAWPDPAGSDLTHPDDTAHDAHRQFDMFCERDADADRLPRETPWRRTA